VDSQGNPVAKQEVYTKAVSGAMYSLSMALLAFLALQVWLLNGKMERVAAQNESQQRFNQRIERTLERLDSKVDRLAGLRKGD